MRRPGLAVLAGLGLQHLAPRLDLSCFDTADEAA
jgi:hypothetical protein